MLGEKVELLLGLHPFRDHFQPEAVRHRDDRLRNRDVVRVLRDVLDERAVDLDAVEREPLDGREGRVTRAEVVDREADAHRLDPVEYLLRARGVLHDHALGDFELEAVRLERALGEGPLDLAQQVLVLELPRRQVHRNGQRGRNAALQGLVVRAPDSEHPGSDRNDQPRVLGVPDEFQRRKQSELGMLPPDQRLHARDPAGIDLDLGFVVEDEFVSLQRTLQPGLLGDPRGQVIVHFP